jgi:hypothetical protein
MPPIWYNLLPASLGSHTLIAMTLLDIQVDDIVRLRKQHPCGGWQWRVFRTGADIGIVCLTCHRRLMMPRHKFRKAIKAIEQRRSTLPESENALPLSESQSPGSPSMPE